MLARVATSSRTPAGLLLLKAGMNEIGPAGIGRKSELAVLPDPCCARRLHCSELMRAS